MNYTPNIQKSSQIFISVLQKAKDWFASLSKTEQQNLIDDLEHGAALLNNTRQLNAYLTMTISKILSLLNHRGRIYNVASNM